MSPHKFVGHRPLEEPSFSERSPNPVRSSCSTCGKAYITVNVPGPLMAVGGCLQGGTVKLGEPQGWLLRFWVRPCCSPHRKYTSTSYPPLSWYPEVFAEGGDSTPKPSKEAEHFGRSKFSRGLPSRRLLSPSCLVGNARFGMEGRGCLGRAHRDATTGGRARRKDTDARLR